MWDVIAEVQRQSASSRRMFGAQLGGSAFCPGAAWPRFGGERRLAAHKGARTDERGHLTQPE